MYVLTAATAMDSARELATSGAIFGVVDSLGYLSVGWARMTEDLLPDLLPELVRQSKYTQGDISNIALAGDSHRQGAGELVNVPKDEEALWSNATTSYDWS